MIALPTAPTTSKFDTLDFNNGVPSVIIIMSHIPGIINPADDLTKALGWILHTRHARFIMGHFRFQPTNPSTSTTTPSELDCNP